MRRSLLQACAVILLLIAVSCATEKDEAPDPYSLKGVRADAVISVMLADVYSGPGIQHSRLTQLPYNHPVKIMDEENGYLRIELHEGRSGYIGSIKITKDTSSLETDDKDRLVIVTGYDKTVYSRPDGKVPVTRIVTGTRLPYRGKTGDWISVALPGGENGYVTLNDIILSEGGAPKTDVVVFTRNILMFENTRYLQGGASFAEGIDIPNLARVCGAINGIELPFDLKGYVAMEGGAAADEYVPGDLLLLSADRFSDEITELAVAVTSNTVMMHSASGREIAVMLMVDMDIRNRVRKVIKVFGEDR